MAHLGASSHTWRTAMPMAPPTHTRHRTRTLRPPVQREPGHGGVGAGDGEEDGGVIGAPHAPAARRVTSGCGGRRRSRRTARPATARRPTARRLLGVAGMGGEDGAGDQCGHQRAGVQPAAQQRADSGGRVRRVVGSGGVCRLADEVHERVSVVSAPGSSDIGAVRPSDGAGKLTTVSGSRWVSGEASAELTAMTPGHEHPFEGVVDSAEVAGARPALHHAVSATAGGGVAHGRVEGQPSPQPGVMCRRRHPRVCLCVLAQCRHPPQRSMHRLEVLYAVTITGRWYGPKLSGPCEWG